MKNHIQRFVALVAFASAMVANSYSETLVLASGESFFGMIQKVLEGTVTISVSGGDKVEHPIASFDAASQDTIKKWVSSHPEAVDVYTKWDTQPVIKSSAMPQLPEQFHDPEFKGMVAVDLVLDESGRVIHAVISKSTHAELEDPSVEAAKTWLFEPAVVAGKAVKSKLRVPFKFTFSPPAAG